MFYPGDDGKVSLDVLKRERSVVLNVAKNAMLFDGNRAHRATKISSGERFSIIGYTMQGAESIPNKVKKLMHEMGFVTPTLESVKCYKALLYSQPYRECCNLAVSSLRKSGKRARIL